MENVNVNVNERVSLNKEREQSFAKVVNERLGETRINNQGEVMFIIEYVNALDITVQFKTTGEVVKTTYNHFVRGEIKSHFTPTVYGVGVKGIEPTVDENGKMIDSYKCWCHMLERCYSSKYQKNIQPIKGAMFVMIGYIILISRIGMTITIMKSIIKHHRWIRIY